MSIWYNVIPPSWDQYRVGVTCRLDVSRHLGYCLCHTIKHPTPTVLSHSLLPIITLLIKKSLHQTLIQTNSQMTF